jgi:metal-responsive CopG/Arc/MetJ family transcriptional regulator
MSYVTVKIPKELAREIDEFIEESKNLGYISRAELVKDAVRRLLDHEKGKILNKRKTSFV